MNHPTQEELIEFLCAEVAPERNTELIRHLEICPACRAQMDSWRGAQRELAAWKLPVGPRATVVPPALSRVRLVRWAAAACLLFAGYGVARLTAPASRVDATVLRAQVAEEVRGELQQFAAAQAKRQEQYQQALTRTLGEIEARRFADYTNLRRDVETVAVRAEDELLNTREGLARLAAHNPPRPMTGAQPGN